jgi:hypothetical protein
MLRLIKMIFSREQKVNCALLICIIIVLGLTICFGILGYIDLNKKYYNRPVPVLVNTRNGKIISAPDGVGIWYYPDDFNGLPKDTAK